jgi:hypothetical protein
MLMLQQKMLRILKEGEIAAFKQFSCVTANRILMLFIQLVE